MSNADTTPLYSPGEIIEEFFVDGEAQVRNPILAEFYGYWKLKHRDAALPGRRDLDPADFRHHLSNVMLVDVLRENGRRRFRFRLMGDLHVQIAGRNMTGEIFDQAFSDRPDRDALIDRYEQVCDRRKPHYWRRTYLDEARNHLIYQRLILPLASDGDTVDMILSALAGPVWSLGKGG